MYEYYNELKNSSLLRNMSRQEAETCFKSFRKRMQEYKRGEIIFCQGAALTEVGIILSGIVSICKADINGRDIVLYDLTTGMIFGEFFATGEKMLAKLQAVARTKSRILYINADQFFDSNFNPACYAARKKMLDNIPKILFAKLLKLSYRVAHLLQGSVRGKILSFLNEEYDIVRTFNQKDKLNKTNMAAFLNVDRASLSKELALMQKEGLIIYDRHKIILKERK
ncbi:MAG: Crp/Fnr family transcriptional regulator [Elusimicrobiota bacterium]|jgi:CRP-like cAMP-binding protein|nr:Crp/Fnr family transcriptional regulator [Elusimicrobiota bacterium]